LTYPVVLNIHGGPAGAESDRFSTILNQNVLASAGYVYLSINFHGSTGYGQPFADSILNNWGSYPFQDLMKGLDHVIRTYPFVDGDRVAAMGASYGGYMVNWINGHTDRFKCLINHAGVFSLVSMYYTLDMMFLETQFGGTPYNRRSMYEKWSPEQFVNKWKTPTLVIHGGRDYRVPEGEGLATFTALQRQGVESKLLYFPDEGHGVANLGNSIRWQKEILAWLDKHMTRVQSLELKRSVRQSPLMQI
jgi:dipeptidyl aminopeptidase/acylaminoacyl peptidase